jgi:LPXTG-motif cell wall-anchored protein
VPAPRRIAVAAAVLAVAFAPGAAVAQTGAGDEQYSDPFAESPAPKPKPKPKPTAPAQQQGGGASGSGGSASGSGSAAGGGSASGSGSAAGAAASGSARRELPRTGSNLLPLVILGLALVAIGLLLRRRAGRARE